MSSQGKNILIVDDEPDIVELLEYNLESAGYQVLKGKNGKEAIALAIQHKPDMIILDVMMPIMDGIQACEKIRSRPELATIPILFLTARSEEYAELAGFEAGADDYIAKPIKPRVLLKRIHALFKRKREVEHVSNSLHLESLVINKDEYVVLKDKKEVELTRREFELLFYLASRPGRLFNRQELLEKIWGNIHITDRTVDVHVRKLREKLGNGLIITVKGVGYKFRSPQ